VAASGHRLKSPPIVEALIEIRAVFENPLELSMLDPFREEIARRYPSVENQLEWTARIEAASGASTGVRNVGLVLKSRDGCDVIQARIDGLRVSRLAPYEHWEGFLAETKNLWTTYSKLVRPQSVARLGVRFINEFVLPLPLDLKAFLKARPEIGPGAPVGDFFLRASVPIDASTMVILTEIADSTKRGPDRCQVVLDIDAFQNGTFDPNSQDLWQRLERLREVKNSFFFGSVTDQLITLVGGER
jgi:uncharacterized protein (TIGR04255 family)